MNKVMRELSTLETSEYDFELGIPGFRYADLYDLEKLRILEKRFYDEVESSDPKLWQEWKSYKEALGQGYDSKVESDLIVRMAKHLQEFLTKCFRLEQEIEHLRRQTDRDNQVVALRTFIQRRALKKYSSQQVMTLDYERLSATVEELEQACFPDALLETDPERRTARVVAELLALEKEYSHWFSAKPQPVSERTVKRVTNIREKLKYRPLFAEYLKGASNDPKSDYEFVKQLLGLFEAWAAARYYLQGSQVEGWVSYRRIEHLDYAQLVQIRRSEDFPQRVTGPEERLRYRDGFKLTDPRYNSKQIMSEVDYCLYCHERNKDSCSTGFIEKGEFKKNPLGITLAGCPLDERISEAHMLRRDAYVLAALATIMIDNPMLPGTGHRICNDCMKSCIFQKQEPVNIPQIETSILTDVLKMRYGFEVYGLLTRWNPLNVRRPVALPYNGKNVLIVGMGPAGYTLAHYLLNEGFGVVGIDGLKIEPLDEDLTGCDGKPPRPIKDFFGELYTELDKRTLFGFGGVSEYGITVRWDKNFLMVIYLTLLRRKHFKVFGGVRFGGTITIDDAWDYGFDHIAMATGAGKPTIVPMKNNLIRGIRQASDFLMALQLTGAYKADAMANLQVRLPAVVIGGGLTAIDTATELMAYYPVQVEKIASRYDKLVEAFGEEVVLAGLDQEERSLLAEYVEHGRQVIAERRRAFAEGRRPNFIRLVRKWGGVSIAYRKTLRDSPAYRLNHEEVSKALEEGISFIENLTPVEAVPDEHGAVRSLKFRRKLEDGEDVVELPARTVCVAAGTSPNVIYEKEYPGTFLLDGRGKFFAGHRLVRDSQGYKLELAPGAPDAFFTSYNKAGKYITYYGDNHPAYAGNVVKAMASAKAGYKYICELFSDYLATLDPSEQPSREASFNKLIASLEDDLTAKVVKVERLAPTIVEVVVRAPMAARKFRPGQFYRLQNFERDCPVIEGTKLMLEGLALTGAWVDSDRGWLSMIVLEMGVSSRLCASLRPGQQVVVMGPTGTPTEIPQGENVLLAGGGLGNAVLFSIAKALKARNNCVVYFAGYRRGEDVFKREEIEKYSDQVVWSTDAGTQIEPNRPQDRAFRGNIVEAIAAYAAGKLGPVKFSLCDVDRIIAIGSDRMMRAIKTARRSVLRGLREDHVAIGSINSPMQCMMKEVCAQCLQRHVDPNTGEEIGFVFSCFNQDQLLDYVDFDNLNDRLRANSLQEKFSNLWLDYLLTKGQVMYV
ncbi:MAG: FAD-dependent oxidoreductase [Acidobacteriota bacterium]|nr:FAD-dependent oxidoreductase [Blastocatellia bacterium]MDW8411078.1 FAD-dependent oxidoreductase [Acidobacteriota bacterium]